MSTDSGPSAPAPWPRLEASRDRRVPWAGPAQHTPQPGRTPGYQIGEGSPTGEAGFVNVNGRLFAPLQGLNPADVTQGGYGWLDKTDGGATFHCGVDLNAGGSCNADEGVLVVAPLAAVVRAALWWDGYTSGEGNHLWLELDDPLAPAPTWVHFDHLQRIDVVEGQRLVAGEPVARAGRTGGWDCAHLHTELLPAAPAQGYWQWPYGWSKGQVEAAYYSPSTWWQAASAKAQGAPEEVVMAILEGWQLQGLGAGRSVPAGRRAVQPGQRHGHGLVRRAEPGRLPRAPPRGRAHHRGRGVARISKAASAFGASRDGAVSWNG